MGIQNLFEAATQATEIVTLISHKFLRIKFEWIYHQNNNLYLKEKIL